MRRSFSALLLSSAVALLTAMAQAETLDVRLVLSDDSPPYRQFSAALNDALAAGRADVAIIESRTGNGSNADLVVAVGTKATELALARSDVPVLAVMIPRMGYESLLERGGAQKRPKATSAIFLGQPWSRQMDFIRAALPGRRRVGLLYPPDMQEVIDTLRRSAAEQGLSITAQPLESAGMLFDTLEVVLNDSDLLLAIPDSVIYGSGNVRNILLTSYRHKIPMIGISQAYVNAGALGAIFSTPEQIAGQTAGAIASFARSGKLPDPQHPASFTISLNQQVARSLGIVLDSPEAIRERMAAKGREGRR